MHKKILSIALLTSLSAASLAATQTFQASVNAYSDASIAQTAALNFGAMQPTATSSCSMDNAGAVSGDCDASNANIALGVISVTGLQANTPLNVTVTGGSGSNVSFVSTVDILNASATHTAVADATIEAVTTDGTGSDLDINVYGTMTVDTDLTPGQTYTADYTVDVVFQ